MLPEKQLEPSSRFSQWLDQFARRYPKGFDLALGLLVVAVTIVLLLKTGYTLVLYQAF